LAALYRAFGERAPVSPVRVRVVPEDVEGFVAHVYAALGGIEVSASSDGFDQQSRERHSRDVSDNYNKAELANKALEYLRLEEGFGRPPTLKEFGKGGFEYRAAEAGLGTEAEAAWGRYERIIRDALAGPADAPGDGGELERGAGHTHYGKGLPETDRSTSRQPVDGDDIAEDPSETFGTETQRQPGSRQERSWWRRLFEG
jgi:hypothetical protein